MFNRISDLSNKSLSSGDSATSELDGGPLDSLLDESESLQYVLSSTSGIDHTTNGRSTSIEPSGDHAAYAVVTNRHVYFLLGDDLENAEVTFRLADVTTSELKSGLLNATLLIRTEDGSVRFTPTDADIGSTVADYVGRLASAWGEFDAAISDAEATLGDIKARLEAGEKTSRLVQAARSYISNAHHCATYDDDAPTGLMTELIEPVETELDHLCSAIEAEQIEETLDEARQARAEGKHEAAFEALAEAHTTIEDGRKAVTDGGILETINELGSTYDQLVTITFEDAETSCHDGLAADDPREAVPALEEGHERYRAALSAGWDGEASVSADALRFQLTWVSQHLVDALKARADALEDRADELGEGHDDASDYYERAIADLSRANDIAGDHAHVSVAIDADRVETLQEKRERAQWQWGGD